MSVNSTYALFADRRGTHFQALTFDFSHNSPGATGTLTLKEVYQISLDPTIPTTGISQASSTISVLSAQILEPNNTTALIGIGVIGVAFLLRRRNLKAAER